VAQGLKEIRRRINSVKNIRKITAAMKMVAAANLRRAQQRAEAGRPYAEAIRGVLGRLSRDAGIDHPFLTERPVRATLAVVVTSDRGLAGAFNANITRAAVQLLRDVPGPAISVVGRKGRDFFRRRHYEILHEHTGLGDAPRFAQAERIASEVTELYASGRCDQVYLVYPQFVNAITSRPVSLRLLPLTGDDLAGDRAGGGEGGEYLFEPDAAAVLHELLPHYISTLVFRALLEAKASEFGARMAAMDNATKNAGEVIDRLTLVSFRMRQAAITKEIAEIVGGAAALEG
jgi:F-type H+-transporting ATPase subunit gamma